MSEAILPRIALAGNPNCGKTSLFNALTGGRQKVGNYPGVTVERKEGSVRTPSGKLLSVLDLPGTYSLDPRSPDEEIARDVILGRQAGEREPDALVAVADATNLERNLGLVLELKRLGLRVVLALNMMDLARARGTELDLRVLSRELGVPVIPTVAPRKEGIAELLAEVERLLVPSSPHAPAAWSAPTVDEIRARFAEVDRIIRVAVRRPPAPTRWTDRLDALALHPFWGGIILVSILLVLFQAIFAWAEVPKGWIQAGLTGLSSLATSLIPAGALQSLVIDGVIAGVGAVVVFLPQILLLFFFILLLEDSGYMSRAAFLMDRLMGKVGLNGRAFIPLLSSFACAIPGIMATRTIADRRDRLTTILVAPLMTCSARLPVYALLIAAFVPDVQVFGPFRSQGLVLFGLYAGGVAGALFVAWLLRRMVLTGPRSSLLMELPTYKWPDVRSVALGLFERAKVFVTRAGTVILTLSVLLWFVASYPKPPAGAPVDAAHPAISYSVAGRVGTWIEPVLRPLGFDWRISVALIPAFAAREVMVSALSTVYAIESPSVEDDGDGGAAGELALRERVQKDWSMATALSLLVWYIFAMQCLSTLAVTRRETNSWKWPLIMVGYMTGLAYVSAWVTYRIASAMGL